MSGVLVRGVALLDGRRVDVRVRGATVAEIGASLDRDGEEVLDGAGGTLLPGLVDHHLHLLALAADLRSVRCGPPAVRDRAGMRAALAAAPAGDDGWVRGTGYTGTVAGDLDAAGLDRLHATRPVRVQHRSGALWVVNGAGVARLGLATAEHPGVERDPAGRPTGRLWRADDWLRERLGPVAPPDLAAVGTLLLRYGITAVTDATPDLDPATVDLLVRAHRQGSLPQRLQLLGAPLDGPGAPGDPDDPDVTVGPWKIVLADSGLPEFDPLVDRIRAVHAAGRAVAAHVVTREALALLLAALDVAGGHPGDRIEHAALVPPAVVADVARRGLRVVTQPGFLADRGEDYLRDVPAAEHADLYRAGTLLAAGVPVGLSSDAPYGPLDPWQVIAAAVHRRTAGGAIAAPAERLAPGAALAGYLADPADPGGPARRVTEGAGADLVLLDGSPEEALRHPAAERVRAVLVRGAMGWRR